MEKEIFFDVDLIIENNNKNLGNLTTHQLQQVLIGTIIKKAKELKANKIVTNGNIASVITDAWGFTTPSQQFIRNEITEYPIGNIGNIQIFVDAAQKWDDSKIHFENDDKKLARKLKIKTIEKTISDDDRKKVGRLYSGFVLDTNGMLI